MPLFFDVERKNKGIRARWGTLSATKENVINKGAMIKSVKFVLGFRQLNSYKNKK
jgi:hypothetical protein